MNAEGAASSASSLNPGDVVDGKYHIARELGSGAQGFVYLAIDTVLERQVALKLHKASTPVALAQFEREALAMARVRHENVAMIHDFGQIGNAAYIVMEYVHGRSLKNLIRSEPVTIDIALGILDQVAAGLSAVHAQGLVHRDVKPANILISENHRVVLSDFGVAQTVGADVEQIAGTPHYMAPEAILPGAANPETEHLIDVYALGVCVFQMLTGVLPFSGDTPDETLLLHLEATPPALSSLAKGLPKSLDEVVAKCLAKEPHRRYQSAGSFVAALRAARARSDGRPTGPRVLVADDDPDIRAFYSLVISGAVEGVTVDLAENGLVAIQLMEANRPDLVIADLKMPRLDGTELCLALRRAGLVGESKVVVISGTANESIEVLLREIGVREVIPKPVSPASLLSIVLDHLSRPRVPSIGPPKRRSKLRW
ncbi:MAG: protein kinase [Deltaproteobacteria bacterium]|nr:protein kinase [Deltaproteobacteria bacterium]